MNKLYSAIVLTLFFLTSCDPLSSYLKLQEKLLEGKRIQVDTQGLESGYVRIYKDDRQAEIAKELNKLLNIYKSNNEITALYKYEDNDFREVAKILQVLNENKIAIFISAQDIVFGIQPESTIYISSKDVEKAKGLLLK